MLYFSADDVTLIVCDDDDDDECDQWKYSWCLLHNFIYKNSLNVSLIYFVFLETFKSPLMTSSSDEPWP